jgi:hypothetical protein
MSAHDTSEQASRNGTRVHDVDEAALSIRELAARLQVGEQTI